MCVNVCIVNSLQKGRAANYHMTDVYITCFFGTEAVGGNWQSVVEPWLALASFALQDVQKKLDSGEEERCARLRYANPSTFSF